MPEKETEIDEIKQTYDEEMELYRSGIKNDVWHTGTLEEKTAFVVALLKADMAGKQYVEMSGNAVPVPDVQMPAGRLTYGEEYIEPEMNGVSKSQKAINMFSEVFDDAMKKDQNQETEPEIGV